MTHEKELGFHTHVQGCW